MSDIKRILGPARIFIVDSLWECTSKILLSSELEQVSYSDLWKDYSQLCMILDAILLESFLEYRLVASDMLILFLFYSQITTYVLP